MPVAIYSGQDYRITLDTGADLTGATTYQILWKDPDNTKGVWTATISGTKLYYDVVASANLKSGIWEFQANVVIGGQTFLGSIIKQQILDNIK